MTRYILHPGVIKSKNDGDEHYISASALMSLYRVAPRDCVVFDPFWHNPPREGDVHLYPDYHGDYKLPGVAE